MTFGPAASFISELFTPAVRYSSASLAYQVAAVLISGSTPLVMTALIARYDATWPVSLFVIATAVVTLVATWILPETAPAHRERSR